MKTLERVERAARALVGVSRASVVGIVGVIVLASSTQGATGGGPTKLELYRAQAGRPVLRKSSPAAPQTTRTLGRVTSSTEAFHERIRPYLSAGGYQRLFGAREPLIAGPTRSATGERAVAPGGNVIVNDPTGETCGLGCTQSETSIAVSGNTVVVGYNDSFGGFGPEISVSGYSYSIDGGSSWIDGGSLPTLGSGDQIMGDPSIVSCNGAFYYASLYATGCNSSPGTTLAESEPNDSAAAANVVGNTDEYTGEINPGSDVDYVSFSVTAGTLVDATVTLDTLGDSTLELFDVDGVTSLAFNDDSGGTLASRIAYTIPADGTYFLAVRSLDPDFGGTYTLQLRSCAAGVPPNVAAVSVSRGMVSGGILQWEPPVAATYARDRNGLDLPDKEYLACDPASGTLYLSYTNFLFFGSGTGQIELVTSTDDGATWSLPTMVEPEDPDVVQQGSYPEVGPAGEVYVAWAQGLFGTSPSGRPTIELRTSLDGGASFPTKTQAAAFTETTFTPPLGYSRPTIADFPSIAVDRSGGPRRGSIYVVFPDADRDIRDVKLARSTDGGVSFGKSVRINDDGPGADQIFPWVAVDPTDGQLSIIWYDRRLDPANVLTDVFLAQSNDGGRTFLPNVRVTDVSSSWFVNSDIAPNFGDYINVTADGTGVYAAWADGRNGDPDVFFSKIPKDSAAAVFLRSAALDDAGANGDGDGSLEPGEKPTIAVTLVNAGASGATGVKAVLSSSTPGVNVTQPKASFGALPGAGSQASGSSPYQLEVDPGLACVTKVVCSPITTTIYGVDPGGTIEQFRFDSGAASSVPTPGDFPSGGPDGLATVSPTDAFWVNGFGQDLIIEFDPTTGLKKTGAFPQPSPGTPGCTDGLAYLAPGRLFAQNYCDDAIYEINTATGAPVNVLGPGGGLSGGLAAGAGHLFATRGFTQIVELDPDSGAVLNSFDTPDLNGDRFPDHVYGLAFDGTYLFTVSVDTAPPNVAAVDPASGALAGVSPYVAPSGFLSAMDAVAGPAGTACIPRTFRTVADLHLAISTDQGSFSSSFALPLGRERTTLALFDDAENSSSGWSATGEWHHTSERAASPTHSWYFGRENGPGLGDNAYSDSSSGDLTSPAFSLANASEAQVIFNQFLDREVGFDSATVSASSDGFATSRVLGALDPTLDAAFREIRLDLSPFVGSLNVQVRFHFSADESVTREGWYLDDIRVVQTGIACGADRPLAQSCPAVPQAGCLVPVKAQAASLALKNDAKNGKDALLWKWVKGAGTPVGEFGDPLAATDYGLCIYDESVNTPSLGLAADVPAGGLCGTKHPKRCWKATRKGFAYLDSAGARSGITAILLQSGAAGKASVVVRGKGALLSLPALPLAKDPTVTVQLRNTLGACWSAEYSTATKNTATSFQAKAD